MRGDFGGANDFRIFRQARPWWTPTMAASTAYEAPYVGTAELVKPRARPRSVTRPLPVPATLRIKTVRQEGGER